MKKLLKMRLDGDIIHMSRNEYKGNIVWRKFG